MTSGLLIWVWNLCMLGCAVASGVAFISQPAVVVIVEGGNTRAPAPNPWASSTQDVHGQCKRMGPVDVNVGVHTAASNIKGFAFEFARARPVWIGPHTSSQESPIEVLMR